MLLKDIKEFFDYLSLRKELLRDYQDEGLVDKFSELYKIPFKVDKAGRLYAVINPLLLNIKNNSTSQIYEFTNEGMVDTTYIRQWIFTNLIAVEKMFAAENLLDVLTFDMYPILNNGKQTGNYLVMFVPRGFDIFDKTRKRLMTTLKILLGTVAIAGIALLVKMII